MHRLRNDSFEVEYKVQIDHRTFPCHYLQTTHGIFEKPWLTSSYFDFNSVIFDRSSRHKNFELEFLIVCMYKSAPYMISSMSHWSVLKKVNQITCLFEAQKSDALYIPIYFTLMIHDYCKKLSNVQPKTESLNGLTPTTRVLRGTLAR